MPIIRKIVNKIPMTTEVIILFVMSILIGRVFVHIRIKRINPITLIIVKE